MMRKSMPILFAAMTAFAALPALAGGHGGGHGGAIAAGVHGGMMRSQPTMGRFDSGMMTSAMSSRFDRSARVDARARIDSDRITHGNMVSAAARDARTSGVRVGSAVRTSARSQSQGSTHASATAIDRVTNSKGRANENSVLGTGSTSRTTSSNRATLASARSNSQGPLHASDRAIDRVANNPGRADEHSVLAGATGGNKLARDKTRTARVDDDADEAMELQDDGLDDFDDGD